jgi:hypothetical protein
MEDVQPTHEAPEPENKEEVEAEALPTQAPVGEASMTEKMDTMSHDPPSSPHLPPAMSSDDIPESMTAAPAVSLAAEVPAAEPEAVDEPPLATAEEPAPLEEIASVGELAPVEVPEAAGNSAAIATSEDVAIDEASVPAVVDETPAVVEEPTEVLAKPPAVIADEPSAPTANVPEVEDVPIVEAAPVVQEADEKVEEVVAEEDGGEDDLLGNLEKHLGS